jgi:hypothetical protein
MTLTFGDFLGQLDSLRNLVVGRLDWALYGSICVCPNPSACLGRGIIELTPLHIYRTASEEA